MDEKKKNMDEKKEEKEEEKEELEEKNETEELKKVEEAPIPAAVPEEIPAVEALPEVVKPAALEKWVPKTQLGKEVFSGQITDIDEVLKSGKRIFESEIIDKLVPNLKNELIFIGGRTGKGGGMQRIPIRITAAMHKSGRRFTTGAFVVVGNEDSLVGIGQGKSPETRHAIEKAIQKAKLSLIRVKRGCGSWECGCKENHSIPYKTVGKSGSVRVEMIPAPKGMGLVAGDEAKKILKLAGIKDIWIKAYGNTSMRINLISAIYNALKRLYIYEK